MLLSPAEVCKGPNSRKQIIYSCVMVTQKMRIGNVQPPPLLSHIGPLSVHTAARVPVVTSPALSRDERTAPGCSPVVQVDERRVTRRADL